MPPTPDPARYWRNLLALEGQALAAREQEREAYARLEEATRWRVAAERAVRDFLAAQTAQGSPGGEVAPQEASEPLPAPEKPKSRRGKAQPAPEPEPPPPPEPARQASLFGTAGEPAPEAPPLAAQKPAPRDDDRLKFALFHALHPTPQNAELWARVRLTGVTDDVLRLSLGSLWHAGPRRDEPEHLAYFTVGGDSPALWLGRLAEGRKGLPTLEGPALISKVRELLALGLPVAKEVFVL